VQSLDAAILECEQRDQVRTSWCNRKLLAASKEREASD